MTKQIMVAGSSRGLLLAGLMAVLLAEATAADVEASATADDSIAAFYVSKRILDKVREKLDNKEDVDEMTIELLVSDRLPDDELMVPVDLTGTDFEDTESWMSARGALNFSEAFVSARRRLEELEPDAQAPPMTAEEWRKARGIILPEPPLKEMPEDSEEEMPEDLEQELPVSPEPHAQQPEEAAMADPGGGVDGGDGADAGSAVDARCAAHEACKSLQVFCCPTLDNVLLDCCYGAEPLLPLAAPPLLLLGGPEPETSPPPETLPAPEKVREPSGLGPLPPAQVDLQPPQSPAYVYSDFWPPNAPTYFSPLAPPPIYSYPDAFPGFPQHFETIYMNPPPAPQAYTHPAFSQTGFTGHPGRSFGAGLEPPVSF